MLDSGLEELNAVRSREISAKAISGILLLLLKWFKLSRMSPPFFRQSTASYFTDILRYEYLTQLLLDANYLPLILKLFAHQDIDHVVDLKNDLDDLE